jgi:hypothetical protein
MTAALWMVVYTDYATWDLAASQAKPIAPSGSFVLMVRMVAASAYVVLALGAVADGQNLVVARSLGIGRGPATVYASSVELIQTIQISFELSKSAH